MSQDTPITPESLFVNPVRPVTFLSDTPNDLSERIYLRAIQSGISHLTVGQSALPDINRVALCPLVVMRDVKVTHASIYILVAGGAGTNFRMGIYEDGEKNLGVRDDPENGRLLWQSDSQDANVTGIVQIPINGNLDLFPGLYWTGVISDNAVMRWRFWAWPCASFNNLLDGCLYTVAAPGFALLDPCPSVIRNTNYAPVIVLSVTL